MKRLRWRVVLAVPAAVLLSAAGWLGYVAVLTRQHYCSCLPPGNASTQAEARFAELQAILDAYSAGHAGVGLQATLVLPDGGIWSGAAGYANHADRCPLTLDHHLYIGSITKLFTAALVMHQVEAGTVKLSATLETWFDAPWASRVRVENLLNHTSGLHSLTHGYRVAILTNQSVIRQVELLTAFQEVLSTMMSKQVLTEK